MRSPKPSLALALCIGLAAAVLLALALPAKAAATAGPTGQDRPETASTLILIEENDFFGGTDEHYTNGIKLSWVSGDLKKYAQDERLPDFVLPYLAALPFVNDPDQQYNVALSAGQNMYTPRNTSTTEYQPEDRPYAGWSYASLALHGKTSRQLDTFETTLGIVGPSARAGETQNNYHTLMGFKRARGWENQIHDEPGLMLSWQRTLRTARVDLGHDVAWDLLPRFGATVGNVLTQASAGFETRLGLNLPWDFGTSLISPGGGVSAPADTDDPRLRKDSGFGLHLFAGAEGRAVARNIFLDGNTWQHSPSVTKKHFVADLSAGVGLVMGATKLTYTHVYRTEEYDGQKSPQMFGSVSLSVTF
ncbi:MAG: lipid A deacylase LpxR family protein [Humidesulfovibrio sp.]|uniref:lipid A deacylase LpxR family protein n=1 Tax=Humidesulfovibrio sp. TaxID=2910988 RepID=UPI002734C094|nr:lipid A deacylase LpxR family protein [Humidesulfovibrio sp.]MDP2849157.1 lipid A deacylase LpxR family protein [Humidesulfovibrio sp.]